ncbi:unnamed protein product [Effrenium voratum]|nr:unnamed protein product [Effrenium voratum]
MAKCMRRALALEPGRADAWLFLAEWCYRTGDFQGAFEAFDQVCALAPGSPMADQAATDKTLLARNLRCVLVNQSLWPESASAFTEFEAGDRPQVWDGVLSLELLELLRHSVDDLCVWRAKNPKKMSTFWLDRRSEPRTAAEVAGRILLKLAGKDPDDFAGIEWWGRNQCARMGAHFHYDTAISGCESDDPAPRPVFSSVLYLGDASVINYPAVLLVLLCTILLANGTKASKLFTNVSTAAKIGLILFMIATALAAFDAKNFQPFISEDHGISGILRGATDSFFGFLGFDAVCALATETKDARRVVPMALFLGLLISGGLTCLAGFALVSCVPADQLDPAAGFVSAFELLQLHLAARLVAVGELLVLPVVAFGCLLPLGRLLCCLAEDGFLPLALAQKDRAGEPLAATVLGGAVTAVCAGLVPFEDLNDICSAAVLTCFILASVSAVTARQEGARQAELRPLLAAFVACSCGALLLLSPRWTSEVALARTLLAESADRAEGLAWPLALVAALCAMKIQERTVQAPPSPPGRFVTPGGATVHLVSILTSAALITTLPAYSLASSAALLTVLTLANRSGPKGGSCKTTCRVVLFGTHRPSFERALASGHSETRSTPRGWREEGELFRVAEAIPEANAAEEAQAEETVGAEDATPWEASEDKSGLQSGSPGPAWEKREGLNCYLHHGAEGIEDKDPLGDAQTLEQCQQECLQEKDCAAIVMHGDSPTTCWLRKDVDMSRCTAGSPYSLWVRPEPSIESTNETETCGTISKAGVDDVTGDGCTGEDGETTPYDAVLALESLGDFLHTGHIKFLQKAESTFKASAEERYKIVSIVGLFDKGKTWLTNRMLGTKLPNGKLCTTRGLSFLWVEDRRMLVLDSAGVQATVSYRADRSQTVQPILDARATESLVFDMISRISHHMIFVVNDFTWFEQEYVEMLHQKYVQGHHNKELIVVHNLRMTSEVEEAQELFYRQIKSCYEGGVSHINDLIFTADAGEGIPPVHHIALCKDGSEAGHAYNEENCKYLMQQLEHRHTLGSKINLTELLRSELARLVPKFALLELAPESQPTSTLTVAFTDLTNGELGVGPKNSSDAWRAWSGGAYSAIGEMVLQLPGQDAKVMLKTKGVISPLGEIIAHDVSFDPIVNVFDKTTELGVERYLRVECPDVDEADIEWEELSNGVRIVIHKQKSIDEAAVQPLQSFPILQHHGRWERSFNFDHADGRFDLFSPSGEPYGFDVQRGVLVVKLVKSFHARRGKLADKKEILSCFPSRPPSPSGASDISQVSSAWLAA